MIYLQMLHNYGGPFILHGSAHYQSFLALSKKITKIRHDNCQVSSWLVFILLVAKSAMSCLDLFVMLYTTLITMSTSFCCCTFQLLLQ